MDIFFNLFWELIIDDVLDAGNVESSGRDGSGNQNRTLSRFEIEESFFPLWLEPKHCFIAGKEQNNKFSVLLDHFQNQQTPSLTEKNKHQNFQEFSLNRSFWLAGKILRGPRCRLVDIKAVENTISEIIFPKNNEIFRMREVLSCIMKDGNYGACN